MITTEIPADAGHELADLDLVQALRRPPWHAASTREISDATGISFGRLSNWICRRQWVPPEPPHIYRKIGNKRLYRIDRVTEWLTGVAMADQAQSYLRSVGLAADDRELWGHVRVLESMNLFPHAWRPRDQAVYLAGLGR